MPDVDNEIRIQLLRTRPELSLSNVDTLIRGVATSCLKIRDDAVAREGHLHEDFVTFCQVKGVTLAAIFRQTAVEFLRSLLTSHLFMRLSISGWLKFMSSCNWLEADFMHLMKEWYCQWPKHYLGWNGIEQLSEMPLLKVLAADRKTSPGRSWRCS